MMRHHEVDGLNFDFPDDWQVSKYDDWSFYRNQFGRMRNGIKSLDLLAIDPSNTAWLIEVKDYRVNPRTKPSDLGEEVAHKVFDTLAAILPAKIHATDADEKKIARAVAACRELRVVLHLEQPAKHSKLRPRAIDPANVKQKLRQFLKPIDAHPKVVDMATANVLGWVVS
jgi:hypothetical protein